MFDLMCNRPGLFIVGWVGFWSVVLVLVIRAQAGARGGGWLGDEAIRRISKGAGGVRKWE